VPHLQDHFDAKRPGTLSVNRASSFKFQTITLVRGEQEHALDQALEETFPASDPVSITITVAVRVWPEPRDIN
jgi:hypothetical protein